MGNNVRLLDVHHPTFNGKHNEVKAKAFILLENAPQVGLSDTLTYKEIAYLIGSNENSMHVLVSHWAKWHMVDRIKVERENRHSYGYRISTAGRAWLLRNTRYMPLLKEWKEEIARNISKLLRPPT
jgi:hypothetical protein